MTFWSPKAPHLIPSSECLLHPFPTVFEPLMFVGSLTHVCGVPTHTYVMKSGYFLLLICLMSIWLLDWRKEPWGFRKVSSCPTTQILIKFFYQFGCSYVNWSYKRKVACIGEEKSPLLFKVLLTGLIIKLTWDRLAGKTCMSPVHMVETQEHWVSPKWQKPPSKDHLQLKTKDVGDGEGKDTTSAICYGGTICCGGSTCQAGLWPC